MSKTRAVVFDAYGTLLDVHAAMARHAGRLGANWQDISAVWRRKQLEYSWVRSLTGPEAHRDFWHLTKDALAWTAARHGISDTALLNDVLDAYRVLQPFDEVPEVLRRIQAMGLPRAILSNGTEAMLADAVASAKIDHLLDFVMSIDTVGVFKPDPRVYHMAETTLGYPASQIAFVSSNAWDAFGARSFGFQVYWVNRAGDPPEYGSEGGITELLKLTALPDLLS